MMTNAAQTTYDGSSFLLIIKEFHSSHRYHSLARVAKVAILGAADPKLKAGC
jgi:hypothetical protein